MSRHNRERKKNPHRTLSTEENNAIHQQRFAAKKLEYPVAPTYRDDNPNPHEGQKNGKPELPASKTGGGFRRSSKSRGMF